MSGKIPEYITKRYEKGAHGFRMEKRKQVREMRKALKDFRFGCFYFPCSANPIHEIEEQLDIIQKAISVKSWGK